jgi:hypothetical protein
VHIRFQIVRTSEHLGLLNAARIAVGLGQPGVDFVVMGSKIKMKAVHHHTMVYCDHHSDYP